MVVSHSGGRDGMQFFAISFLSKMQEISGWHTDFQNELKKLKEN